MRLLPNSALLAALLAAPVLAGDDRANPEIRNMGNCSGCVLDGGDHAGARLMGIDLADADLDGVSFAGATMMIAVFDGAELDGVNFDGANLRGATFVGARLVNVSFRDADLEGAVFEGAILEGTDLRAGRLCKTQMPDDEMADTSCN